jgi:hypothetical protein
MSSPLLRENNFTFIKQNQMKKITIALLFITALSFNLSAQEASSNEKFGKALNLGLGIGYYGYLGGSTPVFHLNYEFDVAKDFTVAPFVTFFSYSRSYYWGGNKNFPSRYYSYRETVIPIGAKGTYYFDDLLDAGAKWDFYLAGSLGFAIVNSSWENGYEGDQNVYHRSSALYLDFHIGTEYHFNNRIGAFLDFSTGISTIGIAIH